MPEAHLPPRPDTDDRAAWKAYWSALGMPWRTEPEIDAERQAYLAERRAVTPDIERGNYPFRDENGGIKLTRADVEWLLATHESGSMRGPMNWHDPSQWNREGLDLRGAEVSNVDLHGLPLARLRGGLAGGEYLAATSGQQQTAALLFTRAKLYSAHLEGAVLNSSHLEGADLYEAHLEGVDLYEAHLEGADLRNVVFDSSSRLNHIALANPEHIGPLLRDVHWDGVNLSGIRWAQVRMLGEEYEARQSRTADGWQKDATARRAEYERAVRANRQLAAALRSQGLSEDADRFAYRAQVLQREVLRRQRQSFRYVGSILLDLISGYGYRPLRSFLTYILVVCGFAVLYFLMRDGVHPALNSLDALIFSITSFHGRGFNPGESVTLHNPLTIAAAFEAIIGLLIEITFIATFTQRFFAR